MLRNLSPRFNIFPLHFFFSPSTSPPFSFPPRLSHTLPQCLTINPKFSRETTANPSLPSLFPLSLSMQPPPVSYSPLPSLWTLSNVTKHEERGHEEQASGNYFRTELTVAL